MFNILIDYFTKNKINWKISAGMIIFYKKDDAINTLKYLYKHHRKYYYLLDAYYINGKQSRKMQNKLFMEYDPLIYWDDKIKYYYLYYRY